MFVKGQSGNPAGRKPGVKNRGPAELVERMQREMKEKFGIEKYDPVIALAEIANTLTNPLDIRTTAHKEAAKYIRPQLKAVEITGDIDVHMEAKMQIVDKLFGALARATEQKREESEDGSSE